MVFVLEKKAGNQKRLFCGIRFDAAISETSAQEEETNDNFLNVLDTISVLITPAGSHSYSELSIHHPLLHSLRMP